VGVAPPLARVLTSAVLLVIVTVVVGAPARGMAAVLDPSSTAPSLFELAGWVCWLGAAVMVLHTAAHLTGWICRRRVVPLTRGTRAAAVLVVGVVFLAAAVNHDWTGYRVCCGGAGAAARVVRSVH
jgi:hypothetical protein